MRGCGLAGDMLQTPSFQQAACAPADILKPIIPSQFVEHFQMTQDAQSRRIFLGIHYLAVEETAIRTNP